MLQKFTVLTNYDAKFNRCKGSLDAYESIATFKYRNK